MIDTVRLGPVFSYIHAFSATNFFLTDDEECSRASIEIVNKLLVEIWL